METLPEPQAALTQALLLELRGGVLPDVSDTFRRIRDRPSAGHLRHARGHRAGTGPRSGALAAGTAESPVSADAPGAHVGYVLLAGVPPSALRAGLTGSVYLLAMATGRGASPLNALAMAALLMVAWEPRWLWHLSFQLSFAAMAGVVLLGLPAWGSPPRGDRQAGGSGPIGIASRDCGMGEDSGLRARGPGLTASGRLQLSPDPAPRHSRHIDHPAGASRDSGRRPGPPPCSRPYGPRWGGPQHGRRGSWASMWSW